MNSKQVYIVIKYWTLLLLASFVPPNQSDMCPEKVSDGVNSCMADYNGKVDLYMLGKPAFHTGVDVEIIRTMCGAFIRSYRCVYALKKTCPEIEQSEIHSLLSPTRNVAQLCTYAEIYEEYAKYQSCYSRTKPTTDICYIEYRVQAEGPGTRIRKGDLSVINELCTHVQSLLDCIKRKIKANTNACKPGAEKLVGYLVKPSIQYSELCTNDTSQSTTPKSLKLKKPTDASPQYRLYDSKASHPHNSYMTILLPILLSFTLILHLNQLCITR